MIKFLNASPLISGCLAIASNIPFVAIPIPIPPPNTPNAARPAPNFAASKDVANCSNAIIFSFYLSGLYYFLYLFFYLVNIINTHYIYPYSSSFTAIVMYVVDNKANTNA